MAVLANGQPTLLDVSQQFTEDGTAMPVAELMHQTNPELNDIPFFEANSTLGHRIAARQSLPAVALRRINRGIVPTKSQFGSIVEGFGKFAALGKVDADLVNGNKDPKKFRVTQNKGHIEAMTQRFIQSMFYGDPLATPEDFLGLTPRFDTINAATKNTAVQVIDAGGTGSTNCSIWLVGWGEGSVYGTYPIGSKAGIQHEDYGKELVSDGSGGEYPAFRDWFQLDSGIAVEDYRNIVRIANVDATLLTDTGASGAKLISLMVMALEQLNGRGTLNPVFYCPRLIRTYLRLQITNKTNVWLGMKEVAGESVTAFDGAPVRRVDQLSLLESRVT